MKVLPFHGNGTLNRINVNGVMKPTIDDRSRYRFLATRFGDLWKATGWKVSTWVHWIVRHSSALVDLHHNQHWALFQKKIGSEEIAEIEEISIFENFPAQC